MFKVTQQSGNLTWPRPLYRSTLCVEPADLVDLADRVVQPKAVVKHCRQFDQRQQRAGLTGRRAGQWVGAAAKYLTHFALVRVDFLRVGSAADKP